MFALVVRFDLLPGQEAEFDQLVAETLPGIEGSEPGTLLYLVHKVEGEPGARVFYEVYRDRAGFEDHERGEHTKRFLAAREGYLASPPRVEFLGEIGGKGVPRP